MEPDFTGWASKNDIECADGVIIRRDAFAHHDTAKVPLVWQHQHTGVTNILGHGILENHPDGVRIKGYFNDTDAGKHAKSMVAHGDVEALSIFANGVTKKGKNVVHGTIREVSLVIAGANEGAKIDYVYLQHGESMDRIEDEIVLETGLQIEHDLDPADFDRASSDDIQHAQTVAEIYESMTDEQKSAVIFIGDQIRKNLEVKHSNTDPDKKDEEGDKPAESEETENKDKKAPADESANKAETDSTDDADESETSDEDKDKKKPEDKESEGDTNDDTVEHSNKEGTPMGFNQFEKSAASKGGDTIQHDGLHGSAIKTRGDYDKLVHSAFSELQAANSGLGSDIILKHAGTYGIDNIDVLFPDFKATSATPELIARNPEWVQKVIGGARKAPTSKIKTLIADLTEDEARARGYITGTQKKDEVLPFMKRTTGPTTVYKKQKLDRDDIIDITDFDVVAWLKWEIRFMLDEEIARAILIGDGRDLSSEDKIQDPAGSVNGNGIRSILHDHPLYTITVNLPANTDPETTIDEIIRARVDYRGTGNPVYFTTDRNLVDLLLLKDKVGRRLYETKASLATVLGVSEIVTVEAFDQEPDLFGIIVNMGDYTIGANRGGEVSFFDDFDIDFNQFKYLMETRISGALHKPKSAIAIKRQVGTLAEPTIPSYDGTNKVLTIPTKTGIDYFINGEIQTAGNKTLTQNTTVTAKAKSGYYIPAGTNRVWTYAV